MMLFHEGCGAYIVITCCMNVIVLCVLGLIQFGWILGVLLSSVITRAFVKGKSGGDVIMAW